MRQMISDLNQMLEEKARGEEPDFEQFMDKWGQFFPGVKTLDELIEQMSQQMQAMQPAHDSMTPEQRARARCDDAGDHPGPRACSNSWPGWPQNLEDDAAGRPAPPLPLPRRRVALASAGDAADGPEGARRARAAAQGRPRLADFANLDREKMRDLLGEETQEQLDQLEQITKMLEDAGFIETTRRSSSSRRGASARSARRR